MYWVDPFGLDKVDDHILSPSVVRGMKQSYINSQGGTPKSHEEGGLFKDGVVHHAKPGSQIDLKLPYLMPDGSFADGEYHVHPDPAGTDVRSMPGFEIGNPNVPSDDDKIQSGESYSGRQYMITPDGRIIRYGPNGIIEDLGPMNNRLDDSCL